MADEFEERADLYSKQCQAKEEERLYWMKRCELLYSQMNKIKDRLMSIEGVAPAENLISLFSGSTDRAFDKNAEENGK